MHNELVKILSSYNGDNQEECGEALYGLLGKKICARIRPILRNKDKVEKTAHRICYELCEELSQLDIETDEVDNWIYTYATVEAFLDYSYEHGRQFHSTTRSKGSYRFNSVLEDKELSACVKQGMNSDKQFAKKLMYYHFSVRKVVLFQMFVMEQCTISEISDWLRVDKKIVKAKLAEVRKTVMCFDSLDGEKGTVKDSAVKRTAVKTNERDKAAVHSKVKSKRKNENKVRDNDEASQEIFEETPVSKKDRIVSYVFIGIFLIIGIYAGSQKVYARYGTSFWLNHMSHNSGWEQFENNWYYFDENGKAATGYTVIDEHAYYFNQSNVMETGWALDPDTEKWYYLGSNGLVTVGWKEIGDVWYYFDPNGQMKQGWHSESNKWYYFDDYGHMSIGWTQVNGKWYYMQEDGVMAVNTVINGYTVGPDGARVE